MTCCYEERGAQTVHGPADHSVTLTQGMLRAALPTAPLQTQEAGLELQH